MGTREDVCRIARGEVGYNRYNDPQEGTIYGRWYAEQTENEYFAKNGVPYCAMFVSYVLALAGVSAVALPGAYVPTIEQANKKRGRAIPCEEAQAGDLACFDWQQDGESDHIGIVIANSPESRKLTTVEGNTSDASLGNGGRVAIRYRSYDLVSSICVPYYDEESEENEMTDEQAGQLQGIYNACAGWLQGAYNTVNELAAQVETMKNDVNKVLAILENGTENK